MVILCVLLLFLADFDAGFPQPVKIRLHIVPVVAESVLLVCGNNLPGGNKGFLICVFRQKTFQKQQPVTHPVFSSPCQITSIILHDSSPSRKI